MPPGELYAAHNDERPKDVTTAKKLESRVQREEEIEGYRVEA